MRALAIMLFGFALAIGAVACQQQTQQTERTQQTEQTQQTQQTQQTEGTPAAGGLSAVTTDASLEAAFNAAKTDGKPVVAIFSAPAWCHWCQKLAKETLTDANVQQELKKLHVVFVDFDKEKELVSKYEIQGVPETVIFDSSGNRLHDILGFRTAPDFLAEIRQAVPQK